MTRHRIGFVLGATVASLSLMCGGIVAATAAGGAETTSANLIKNGGAEKGTGSSDGSVVPVPNWTDSTGATFTAVQYGASGGFPDSTTPGPPARGKNFFAGGPGDPLDTIVAVQTVKLSSFATAIKTGKVKATLVGWLGGYATQSDEAFVEVDFHDASGNFLSSLTIGPVSEADRGGVTELLKRQSTALVPKKARSAFVQLSLSRVDGNYNDGYADALSLKLTGI